MQTLFTALCLLGYFFTSEAVSFCDDTTKTVLLSPTNAPQFLNCTSFAGSIYIGWFIFLQNHGVAELAYLNRLTHIETLVLMQPLNLTALNGVQSINDLDLEGFFEPVGPSFFPLVVNGTYLEVSTNGTDFSYLSNLRTLRGLWIGSNVDLSFFRHMRLDPNPLTGASLVFGAVSYNQSQLANLLVLGPPHNIELVGYLGTSFNASMFWAAGCPAYGYVVPGVTLTLSSCPNLVDVWINCPVLWSLSINTDDGGPMENFFPEGLHFQPPLSVNNLYVDGQNKWLNMSAFKSVTISSLEVQNVNSMTSLGITQTWWDQFAISNAPSLNSLPDLSTATFIAGTFGFSNVNLTSLDLPLLTSLQFFNIESMPNLRSIHAPLLSEMYSLTFQDDPVLSVLDMCRLCSFFMYINTASIQNTPMLSCSGLATLYQNWIGSAPTTQIGGCDNAHNVVYCSCQAPSSSSIIVPSSSRFRSSSVLSTGGSGTSTGTGGGNNAGDSSSTGDGGGGDDGSDTTKKIAQLVIGIVIIVAVIAIIAGCIVWCRRRRARGTNQSMKLEEIASTS